VAPPGNWKSIKVNSTFPMYTSVANNIDRITLVAFVKMTLAYFTGQRLEADSANTCYANTANDSSYEYFWMNGPEFKGVCYKSSTYSTVALSPALDEDSGARDWYSTEYSTWTESVWTVPKVRIFLKPSALMEWMTLTMGLIILLLSFLIVYVLEKHSETIFKGRVDTAANGSLVRGGGSLVVGS
jgi:nicastrin